MQLNPFHKNFLTTKSNRLIQQPYIAKPFNYTKLRFYSDLVEFLQHTRPQNIAEGLIRVGGSNDGGYLLPNNLTGIHACFSPGVGDVASFEQALADRGIHIFMADYSVAESSLQNAPATFEKKFIGARNSAKYMRLEDWIAKSVAADSPDLILQMDIEGGEYQVIHDTPREVLQRFRIMAVEFHEMDKLFKRRKFKLIRAVFEKVLQDFAVVHIHPNNCCPVFAWGEIEIPRVLEFTFYRRNLMTKVEQPLVFPHPLDQKNVVKNEDIVLPMCWQ